MKGFGVGKWIKIISSQSFSGDVDMWVRGGQGQDRQEQFPLYFTGMCMEGFGMHKKLGKERVGRGCFPSFLRGVLGKGRVCKGNFPSIS